jgi:hypothetical protein
MHIAPDRLSFQSICLTDCRQLHLGGGVAATGVPFGAAVGSVEIEQIKKRVALAMTLVIIATIARTLGVPTVRLGGRLARFGCLHPGHGRTFHDLVQLSAIKPHATALRAIIYFDALTIRYFQLPLTANRTFHLRAPQCSVVVSSDSAE